jgi:rod shape-determining protein MreC
MVRMQRDNQRGVAILLALLLCGAVSAIHKQIEHKRGNDPVTGVVRDAALVPAQTAGVRVSRWWHSNVASLFAGPRLAHQNHTLETQVMALTAQNRDLLAAQAENDRLRQLLDFERKSSLPLLAAEVTALKPSNQQDTVILNRGTSDGVHVHSIVLAANGALIGQVLDVSAHSCTVLMLTDNNSSVGAEVKTDQGSAPIGVCQGQGSGQLKLTYLRSDAPVAPGATVVSSGLGGTYPANVPVGTVTAVTVDRTRSLKSATIRPAADLDHLDEAFLVR